MNPPGWFGLPEAWLRIDARRLFQANCIVEGERWIGVPVDRRIARRWLLPHHRREGVGGTGSGRQGNCCAYAILAVAGIASGAAIDNDARAT